MRGAGPQLLLLGVAALLQAGDTFLQAPASLRPLSHRTRAAAGRLRLVMESPEMRRRRLLRIAELRQEIAREVQQKSLNLRDKYKSGSGRQGSANLRGAPPNLRGAAAGAAAATGSSAYLDKIQKKARDEAAGVGMDKVAGSFSKDDITREMKGQKRRPKGMFGMKNANLIPLAGGNDMLGPGADVLPMDSGGGAGRMLGKKMDQLLQQRRTSFERRKWGTAAADAEEAECEGGDGDGRAQKRWGPKQLINGPRDMRLKRILRYQQQRDLGLVESRPDLRLPMVSPPGDDADGGSGYRSRPAGSGVSEVLRGGRSGVFKSGTAVQRIMVESAHARTHTHTHTHTHVRGVSRAEVGDGLGGQGLLAPSAYI